MRRSSCKGADDASPVVHLRPAASGQLLMGLERPMADITELLTSAAEPVQAVAICGPARAGCGEGPCMHGFATSWCTSLL